MASTPVRLEALTKHYGEVQALEAVDLAIDQGEFFTLLGPSGCGKTTLLRIVAGFVRQRSGHVWFGDRLLDRVPPHRRNTGLVFQNYAIFPHLTVHDNIAYGLRTRRLAEAEVRRRVARMLSITHLEGLAHRRPQELSGGQQQRVVLARTVVIEPDVLLMDEPLSNLDAELRVRLRNEIRGLQRQIGVTTLYVTHDQEEALSLSDRIAVMHHGRIEQVGTPHEVFNAPATRFVAGFIGESNFLPGQRTGEPRADGMVAFAAPGGTVTVPATRVRTDEASVVLAFRPHQVRLRRAGEDGDLRGEVVDAIYTGATVRYVVRLAPACDLTCLALTGDDLQAPRIGERVALQVPPSAVLAFRDGQT
jgi:ABC-type Fe3+/spermidine/putrescine transport system ATPase subunit